MRTALCGCATLTCSVRATQRHALRRQVFLTSSGRLAYVLSNPNDRGLPRLLPDLSVHGTTRRRHACAACRSRSHSSFLSGRLLRSADTPTTCLRFRPQSATSKTKNVLLAASATAPLAACLCLCCATWQESFLACADSTGRVQHWHITSGKTLHTINEQDNQVALKIRPTYAVWPHFAGPVSSLAGCATAFAGQDSGRRALGVRSRLPARRTQVRNGWHGLQGPPLLPPSSALRGSKLPPQPQR